MRRFARIPVFIAATLFILQLSLHSLTSEHSSSNHTSFVYQHHDEEPIRCDSNGACVDPIGIIGEWVHVGQNRSFDSPLNRGGGGGGGFCQKGLMRTPPLYHGDPNNPTSAGTKCDCPDFVDEYEWSSPRLRPSFSPDETCRRLGPKVVLFVGDSTSQQAASTLMNALRPALCHAQIYSALSDTLDGTAYGAMNRGKRWNAWVEAISPDIVIFSVGAHVSKAADELYPGLIDKLLREIEEMQRRKPNIQFAWKTQSPGGCTKDIVSPQNATAAFEMSVENHRFNYGRFRKRDLILLSRLQKIGMPYLDMRMLYSRSDAHVSSQLDSWAQIDCLHTCIPGPLDVMARLFDQLLVMWDKDET